MARSLGRTGYRYRKAIKRLRRPGPDGQPPACCLCGRPINLALRWPNQMSWSLQHLDGDKDNNHPSNHDGAHLTCNASEGARKRWGAANVVQLKTSRRW